MKRKILFLLPLSLMFLGITCAAQDTRDNEDTQTVADTQDGLIVIEPLFEYPVAPDDLPDLTSRTDYVIENFWNNFDFKSNKAVDQNALNHAFDVFASAMPYATEDKVLESTRRVIKNLKGNPGLTLQFTKAAEEVLYGPRSKMWIDEIYLMFLDNLIQEKNISDTKKARYEWQYKILSGSNVGATAPVFTFLNTEGQQTSFAPTKEYTLIEFGDPDCDDCRYAKLKMDISGVLNDLIDDGRLAVYFITPADEEEQYSAITEIKNYPAKWTAGASSDVDDLYDLRATPAFYILDRGGKIVAKNISVDTAIDILESRTTN